MKRVMFLGVAAAMALAGCSSAAESASDQGPVWPPTGEHLGMYKAEPTYKWRVELMDHHTEVDARLKKLGRSEPTNDYNDLLNTCASIERGRTDAQLRKKTKRQYAVSAHKAGAILALAKADICPASTLDPSKKEPAPDTHATKHAKKHAEKHTRKHRRH